jgi:endonuclease I
MRAKQQAVLSAAVCAALALAAVPAAAQYQAPGNALWNAPTGYYNLATGTGATLKGQLFSTISVGFNESTQAHTGALTTRNYGDLRYAARVLFKDTAWIPTPADPNDHILWVYDRESHPYVWDAGDTWNREHSWPQSKLNVSVSNSYTGPGSDMFEIYPSNSSTNSTRGNAAYGLWPYAGSAGMNGGYFYPGAIDKGDIARSMFYMATRYGQDQNGEAKEAPQNLSLVDGQGGVGQMGHLTSLLHWHYEDGVDNFERRRNYVTYSPDSSANAWDIAGRPALYNEVYNQGNRNPYIDHPEYVWAVFGTGPNNSKIYVGASAPASGASSITSNLRVIKDAPAWGAANVTVNKSGAHPTTYDVITGGSATTTAAGPGQPFVYDPTTRVISVSLNASTSTIGLQSGTVTLDNTDLTTAAAGQGSADGNDTITVSGTVLDHAQASFIAGSSGLAQSIDFSYVPAGGVVRSANFNVYNNAAPAGASFTAGLDTDGVTRVGSTLLSTTVAASNPATPLAAGGNRAYGANFTPGAVEGLISATHTIATSDENIPGAAARPNLVLTTSGRTTTGNFPVSGNLFLFGSETFNTTSFAIADGATIQKQGPGTMNVNGAHGHGATAHLIADGGAVNFLTDANSTASSGLKLTVQTAPVTFQSKQHLRALDVQGNATVATNGDHALVVGQLTIGATALLNLHDNDLIVRSALRGQAGAGGIYDGIQGLVQRGANGGAWDGAGGIVTTTADAASGLTTIGVASGEDIFGLAPTETTVWNGEIVSGVDVLAMYTYAGDGNLDGFISGDDYSSIDFNVGTSADGYFNGDFNYDGIISGDDYSTIDFNFAGQGAPLGSSGVSGADVTAVPEPAACAFAFIGAALAMRRRRRRA